MYRQLDSCSFFNKRFKVAQIILNPRSLTKLFIQRSSFIKELLLFHPYSLFCFTNLSQIAIVARLGSMFFFVVFRYESASENRLSRLAQCVIMNVEVILFYNLLPVDVRSTVHLCSCICQASLILFQCQTTILYLFLQF